MINLYKECKDMPNPSPGLIRLFKKKPHSRIWAMKSRYSRKDFVPLYKLKAMNIHDVELRIGHPAEDYAFAKHKNGKSMRTRAFSGRALRSNMFHSPRNPDVFLVGIGAKGQGTWMIDVTENVVKNLNEVGACYLSRAHCKFELKSPRIKECEFCKRKIYKKTRMEKRVTWESK